MIGEDEGTVIYGFFIVLFWNRVLCRYRFYQLSSVYYVNHYVRGLINE